MDLNSEYKGGDGFIDRSKVRILLCDSDSKSVQEVSTLLTQCSYQVISVRSARQVIDALNAEGPNIDIILAEVDLPMAKGMKMLKYITRDKDLRRIPVIMMSRQDEVSVVVKCLKLGAADYLVKPLRTNELLNLWTHMWRRRRMLGLAEKNMLNYDFDLVGSDPSDANTNSTNLLSDDTDDKSLRCSNRQIETLRNVEKGSSVSASAHVAGGGGAVDVDGTATSAPAVAPFENPATHLPSSPTHDPPKRNCDEERLSSGPKKSKLRIGESSAFFTYVKSTVTEANHEDVEAGGEGASRTDRTYGIRGTGETYSQGDDFRSRIGFLDSMDQSCPPPISMGIHNRNHSEGNGNTSGTESSHAGVSGFSGPTAYPYYMHGVLNQVMMPSSGHVYAPSGMLPQYGHHLPQYPANHPNAMGGFSYYHPISASLQHGQVSMVHHSWPQTGNVPCNELKQVDRREEALIKFRLKRKQRCFEKKIRYVNRKHLAERRPRVRGQFVRKVNGVNVDLNGQPDSDEDDDEDDDDDDDEGEDQDSSHQDDALGA